MKPEKVIWVLGLLVLVAVVACAKATPTAIDSPWPSDPPDDSRPGVRFMSVCPSSRPPNSQ